MAKNNEKIHKASCCVDSACNGNINKPDIIIACAGGTPTLEALACSKILREYLPTLNIKFVNVVDLYKLVSNDRHPHGLTHEEYNKLFNPKVPCIFNFHGYPQLIHELTYNRDNDDDLHVRGYMEEGTITTPFDMRVLNKIDRYNLVKLAVKHLKLDKTTKDKITKDMDTILKKHNKYIAEKGVDLPEVENWKWE